MSNFGDLTEGSVGQSPRGSYTSTGDSYVFSPNHLILGLDSLYGGGRVLMPIHLFEASPGRQNFGVLQGAYRCQGIATSAEDLITVSGVNHLVVQNAFRTDADDYFAVEI